MPQIGAENVLAIILAGGKGTRLRPLTAVFPKPLVPLGNKPIIEILLRQLKRAEFKRINLCTGYLSELIRAVCGTGEKFGLEINYTHEEEPLGTAGPLGLIEERTDPVIVMNGDLLTTLDFSRMLQFHHDESADITIGAYQRAVKIDFGVIESDKNNDFIGFQEKPVFNFEVSMGVNILGQRALEKITRNTYLDMPDLILQVHKKGGRISCYREDCFWLDIGRMDDYALAQEKFSEQEDFFLG